MSFINEEEKDKDKENGVISLLINDTYKSISCYDYDVKKEHLTLKAKDFSPLWITNSTFYSINHNTKKQYYLGSDTDNNIIVFRQNSNPKSEDDKYKIEKLCFFNFGERVNKFRKHTKELKSSEKRVKFTSLNDKVNYSTFATVEGTIGIVIELNRQDFEFLNILQHEIIKHLANIGEFSYMKYRAFKDGFISEESKGFIDGNVLNEFILASEETRMSIFQNLNYAWARTLKDTILMIEMLTSFH